MKITSIVLFALATLVWTTGFYFVPTNRVNIVPSIAFISLLLYAGSIVAFYAWKQRNRLKYSY